MRAPLLLAMAFVLTGCSIDPGATWAPAVLKDKAPIEAPAEPPPDLRSMLRTRLSEFFLPQAGASQISFSPPRRTLLGWQACIRASVNGAMGNALGQQTYLFDLARGAVDRQELVNTSHWCHGEAFQAL